MNRDWKTFCSQPGHLSEYDVKNIQDTTEGGLYGSAPYLLKNIRIFEEFQSYDFSNDWNQLERLEKDYTEWKTKASLSLRYAEARKNPYMIAYANKALNLLPKLEHQIVLCKQILQPYRDASLQDEARKITTRNQFRAHIIKVAQSENQAVSDILSNEDCLLYIRKVVQIENSIRVYIREIQFPYRYASLNKVFAYANGVSIGTPVLEEKMLFEKERHRQQELFGTPFPSSKRNMEPLETEYTFSFKTDKPLTLGEKIKFVMRGQNIDFDCTAPIESPASRLARISDKSVAEKDTQEWLTSGLQILKCKQNGVHLEIPCEVTLDGKSATVDLLMDTGASRTTIPLNIYRHLSKKDLNLLGKITLSTANGMVRVPIDTMDVKTSAYSIPLEVSIMNDDIALLGMDYFAGRMFTIDLAGGCIYIQDSTTTRSPIIPDTLKQ